MQTIGQLHIVNKFLKDLQVEYLRIKDTSLKINIKTTKEKKPRNTIKQDDTLNLIILVHKI